MRHNIFARLQGRPQWSIMGYLQDIFAGGRRIMRRKLADRAGEVYLCLMGSLFLLAVPFPGEAGGYSAITYPKFLLFAVFGVLLIAASLPALPDLKGELRPAPAQLCALLYLFWTAVSTLCSPYAGKALLGAARWEGLVTQSLYVLSFLLLSRFSRPGKPQLICFAGAFTLQGGLCVLQLLGRNPLGLYPAGMGWQDANLRYPGSYLGTLGNAGLTGALLCTACALFLLILLQQCRGRLLLLPPLLLGAWVLGRSGVSAGIWALLATMLLALPAALRTLADLCRVLLLYPPLLAALFLPVLSRGSILCLLLCMLVGVLLTLLPRQQQSLGLRMWLLSAVLLLAAFAYVYTYDGWRQSLQEASALLHGQAQDSFGSGRLYIWKEALAAFVRRPLLGSGPDTLALRGLAPYEWYSAETGKTLLSPIDAAHSEYLQVLVCQGIPAALGRIGLALSALICFFRRGGRASGICAGAALCYSIQACFGISMCQSAPVFWLLLACSENLRRRETLHDREMRDLPRTS